MTVCDLPFAAFTASILPLQNRVAPLPSTSAPCQTIVHLIIFPPQGKIANANPKVSNMLLLQMPQRRLLPPVCFRLCLKCLTQQSRSSARKPALLKPCSKYAPSLTFQSVIPQPQTPPPSSVDPPLASLRVCETCARIGRRPWMFVAWMFVARKCDRDPAPEPPAPPPNQKDASSRKSNSTISTFHHLNPPANHLAPNQSQQNNPPPTPSATTIPKEDPPPIESSSRCA